MTLPGLPLGPFDAFDPADPADADAGGRAGRDARADGAWGAAFDLVGEGFCRCELIRDPSGLPVDYCFAEVNDTFVALTGLADAEGRTARELLGALASESVARAADVVAGGATARYEQRAAGSGRWFDVVAAPSGRTDGFVLVIRDRTELHRQEEALRRSEERFRTMARQLPLIAWEYDPVGSRSWVNAEFGRYFGTSVETTVRDTWGQLLHPEDAPEFVAAFAAAVKERRAFHGETRVRRADGAWRWLESWANPQFDDEGRYVGHLGSSVDVTGRRAAEAALRAAVAGEAYRARLLAALRRVGDPAEVQACAARLLGEHLGASRVHYAEIDAKQTYGVVRAGYHRGCSSVQGVHRFDDFGPLVMARFRAGEPAVVGDVATDPRLSAAERATTAALGAVAAYVMVPLVKDGRSVALLVVHHAEARAYSDEELGLIEDTADLTWAAVEQARAEQALRTRHFRAELAADLLSDLEQQTTVAARLQRLADLLVPRVGDFATVEVPGRTQPVAGIAHADPGLVEVLRSLRVQYGVVPESPDAPLLAAGPAAALLGGPADGPADGAAGGPADGAAGGLPGGLPGGVASALLAVLGPRSTMAVPVDLGGGVHGVLLVGLSDPRRPPYGPEDLAFLEETAQRVGVVLAAARLRQEEHDISVRLQQALLPDDLVWQPEVLVEARYHAASELLDVGGDWYDSFVWPDGRIGVMVGDVVGHNLDSAAAMGRLRAATSALATFTAPSPSAVVEALDRFAAGPNGTDFATAACVVVDPATGQLAYTSAGHPPVIVVPPGGQPRRLLEAQSLPLCSLAPPTRPEAVVTLEPGTLVVLYSDGLVERRHRSIEAGIEGVERLLEQWADEPASVVADRLVAAASADGPCDDDVVVACFRYTPVRARLRRTVPARAERLAGLRADLRTWCGENDVPDDVGYRLLLAAGEACANAVEHAYARSAAHDDEGVLDVDVAHHGHHLTVQVRDHGVWRQPVGQGSDRGRGTMIMHAVGNRFRRTSDADGTTVTITVPLAEEGR